MATVASPNIRDDLLREIGEWLYHNEPGAYLLRIVSRNQNPIFAGDFNLYDLVKYRDKLSEYDVSSEQLSYGSYPKDKSRLDYIVSPKEYRMTNIACPNDYVSDHRALIATFNIYS